MKTLNHFVLRGTIVNQRRNLHNVVLVIATSGNVHRNGNRAQRGRSSDYPNITIYNPEIVADFKIGDNVTVQGYAINTSFQAHNGTTVYTTELVGTEIDRSQRILAKYIPNIDLYDGGQPEDINTTLVVGEVTHIQQTNNGNVYLSLGVDLSGFDRKIYCNVACFGRQATYVQDNINVGDMVATAGAIHTWEHSSVDPTTQQTRNYKRQNVTCLDIAKCESAES